MTKEELIEIEKIRQAYRETAKKHYGSDEIEIDEDADVSFCENGAFVQGWLWVQAEDENNP